MIDPSQGMNMRGCKHFIFADCALPGNLSTPFVFNPATFDACHSCA